MSRFYDAMKRALDAEVDTTPEQTEEKGEFQKTMDAAPEAAGLNEDVARKPVRRFSGAQHRSDESDIDIDFVSNKDVTSHPTPIRAPEEPISAIRRKFVNQEIEPPYERIIQKLHAYQGGRKYCSLLVAGAVAGDGASTVARNLAAALAHSHAGQVVLVDGNMRTPNQAFAFEIDAREGLADVLGLRVKPQTVVHQVAGNLAVMSSGHPKESPPQILTVPALQSVVTALNAQYDWVIFDGPPVTVYPDASSLAAVADGAILVLRAEQTRWEVAEEAKKALLQSGVGVLGGVLNRRKYHIPSFIYNRL